MIAFKNYPPEVPQDVELSAIGKGLIEAAIATKDQERLYAYGQAISSTIIAAVGGNSTRDLGSLGDHVVRGTRMLDGTPTWGSSALLSGMVSIEAGLVSGREAA